MNILFKVSSILLSYPTLAVQQETANLVDAVQLDNTLKPDAKKWLTDTLEDIGNRDIFDAQERYVFLFDRTRTLSLHLFEHVHGEGRDRGQAMVDLKEMYDQHQFTIDAKELPDYLPVFLEFISLAPESEANELLNQIGHLISALGQRLQKRESIYANVFLALETMIQPDEDSTLLDELLRHEDDDPNDLEALDSVWQEDPVTFGGNVGDNSCGLDRIRRQARADQRKPDTTSPQVPYVGAQ